MPTFFFNLCSPDSVDRDEEGVEFADIEAAYLEAFQTASEMWVEAIRRRRDPSHQRFEITDRCGRLLMTVPFTEVIERRMAPRQQTLAQSESRRPRAIQPEAGAQRPAPRRPQPDFRILLEQAQRARDLGTNVIDQIRTARQQIEESRALLRQVGEVSYRN